MYSLRTLTLLAATVLSGGTALHAQSPLIDPGPNGAIWVQVQSPSFEADVSSLLLDAGGQIRLGSRSLLVFALPVVYVAEDLPSGVNSLVLGNPYIGLRQRSGRSTLELGGRVPLMSDDIGSAAGAGIGVLGDFDQFEAYLPELVTFYGRVTMEREPAAAQGMVTRFRIGPTVFVPTGDGGDDVEVMADYRAYVGFRAAAFEGGAALTGRFIVTNADGADFGERTVHHLTLGGSLRSGRVRPTAFLRIPLDDDLKEDLNSVLGVGLVVGLR